MPQLTQAQINILFKMRNEEKNNIFYQKNMPDELIERIGNFGTHIDSHDLSDALMRERALRRCIALEAKEDIHCSDIERALHHAAFARKEDIARVLAMVKINPRLMLEAGNVLTPAGLLIKGVTIYEFFLGAGDPEAAKCVRDVFFKSIKEYNRKFPHDALSIKQAKNVLYEQYERYRPQIEGMLTQQPDDLSPLIEIIKQASTEDVKALLKNDMTRESPLRDAMIAFRKDWAPSVITEPCMHFNYENLRYLFFILHSQFDALYEADNDNYNKLHLVMRQLIGFKMRRLTGIDRCIFAQSLDEIIREGQPIERISVCQGANPVDFPMTFSDDILTGLGFDCFIDIYGTLSQQRPPRGRASFMIFSEYMIQKNLKLTELAMMPPCVQPIRCGIS
jgi:hypothetical protein